MKDHQLKHLFATARRAGDEESPSPPAGFAEKVVHRYRLRVQENRSFFRASILSIATALVILGAVLGINVGSNGYSQSEDQESTVEMAYALWDPVGN
jgi:hypothetical protein